MRIVNWPKLKRLDIIRNLINGGNRGDAVENHLSIFIDPHYFISPPVLHYSSIFHHWFRCIMGSAGINTKFPEQHQQMPSLIPILRALWLYRMFELSTDYETNRKLATMLYRSMHPHTLRNYPKTRIVAWFHNQNRQGDKNPPTYASSSTEDRLQKRPSDHTKHGPQPTSKGVIIFIFKPVITSISIMCTTIVFPDIPTQDQGIIPINFLFHLKWWLIQRFPKRYRISAQSSWQKGFPAITKTRTRLLS